MILSIKGLSVTYQSDDGPIFAVNDIDLSLQEKETLAIVGESGSGKTQSMLSIIGLLPENAKIKGEAFFDNKLLFNQSNNHTAEYRGHEIGMIFQDPMTSLNPYLTIEEQLGLVLKKHLPDEDHRKIILEALNNVKIPDAVSKMNQYPHELSGGMRQRAMIASVLMLKPKILIADEPTTALDVTVQAQILALIKELKDQIDTSIIFITHDLGVVAGISDRVVVMEKGRIVEEGTPEAIYHAPKHSYTQKLIASIPRVDEKNLNHQANFPNKSIDAQNISMDYKIKKGWWAFDTLKAVRNVSCELGQGEILGVVGESGCGKSTLAKSLATMIYPTKGKLKIFGEEAAIGNQSLKKITQKEVQMIFQDPMSSMNPRMNIESILSEPLWTHSPNMEKAFVREKVISALERVGLDSSAMFRYPHEFSGGQCQRIVIARALMLKPKVIICDEPVSALDVSIRKQVLELLLTIRKEINASLLFISHDLSVVRQICDNVMVMYLGQVVEQAEVNELFDSPKHPYTKALIEAVPIPDPYIQKQRELKLMDGDPPSPINLPSGCSFAGRCAFNNDQCKSEQQLIKIDNSLVACIRAREIN
jgi:peptide/nickel transport system ATP-binding protein